MTARTGLAAAIRRHIRHDGENPTVVPGLVLYTRQQATSRMPGIYRPSICFVTQGSKRMYYGEHCRRYDPDNYLIGSLMLPAEAEILDVSPGRPFLALILDIDRPLVGRGARDLRFDTAHRTTPAAAGARAMRIRTGERAGGRLGSTPFQNRV